MRYPDLRLSAVAVPGTTVDGALRAIGERLVAAARAANAFGLAAAHIGEVAPIVVINSDGQGRDYRLLFNPKITASATDTTKAEEGSVSLPGIRVEVERAAWVEVSFQDELGAAKATRFDGFAARVAAHEIDQMNGVFFLERVSRLKREMALKKARKLPG